MQVALKDADPDLTLLTFLRRHRILFTLVTSWGALGLDLCATVLVFVFQVCIYFLNLLNWKKKVMRIYPGVIKWHYGLLSFLSTDHIPCRPRPEL